MRKSVKQWLVELLERNPNRIEPGVERTRRLAQALLGGPPSACVISVAGTNGKGSSVAMVSAICRAAGYRVGTYTSPHFIDVRERFLIDGKQVDEQALVQAFERIDAHPDSGALTYFEWLTLTAFLLFEAAGADVWVLEIGLGGRLDAVNALDADLALITAIGLDHQDWLGDGRELIGREKAGILREGQAAVYADPDPVASVGEVAHAVGAELWQLGQEFDLRDRGAGVPADRCILLRGNTARPLRIPALAGQHQCRNAAGVVALLQHPRSPLRVPDAAVDEGLEQVQLAGRLERRIDRGTIVWFDVAHNTEAAAVLAEVLAATPAPGRRLAVFSALADKPIETMVRPLVSSIDAWWIAPLQEPRAAGMDRIESALAEAGACSVTREADLFAAYNAAKAEAKEGDELIVFGSFHLVGPLRARLSEEGYPATRSESRA